MKRLFIILTLSTLISSIAFGQSYDTLIYPNIKSNGIDTFSFINHENENRKRPSLRAAFPENKGPVRGQNNLEDFIKTGPSAAQSYYYNGLSKEKLGDYVGAIKEYDQSIELDSKNAAVYFARGDSKYYLKDFLGAQNDFTKTITYNHKYAKAFYNRGNADYYLNNRKRACVDWQKAYNLGIKEAKELIDKYCK